MLVDYFLKNSPQKVIIYSETDKNEYGEIDYAIVGNTHKCRFSFEDTEIKKPNGEVVLVNAKCYLYPTVGVEVNDLVEYMKVEYIVVKKYIPIDPNGREAHIKLFLKRYGKN